METSAGKRGDETYAVVDVSGYVFRQVEEAMDVLGDRVGRYLFMVLARYGSRATIVRPGRLVVSEWTTQRRSAARARAAGMTATPLEVTVVDTLTWERARGEPPWDGGLSLEQEAALLERVAPVQGGAEE